MKEHILVSRIFDKKNRRLKACHIAPGNSKMFYVNNTDSFNVFSPTQSPIHPFKCLLGLINSKFIGYYLTTTNVNLTRNIYPKINTNDLKNIPIPNKIPQKIGDSIVSLVEKIIELKKSDAKAKTEKLENKIDLITYKIYNLNYEDACIIEGNTDWMSKEEYEQFKIE